MVAREGLGADALRKSVPWSEGCWCRIATAPSATSAASRWSPAAADAGGMVRAAVCLEGLQARQVQRHRLLPGGADPGHRRRPDGPGGQLPDRRLEGRRGRPEPAGSVVASEALFPFPDGLIAAAEAGATAAIQPGGAIRDAGGHPGRRRTRHGDGLHGDPALQALTRGRGRLEG